MTYQNLKKKTEGFTIIEVLIVLAIAGLILLIVFLAVPALQRNSRNTQMRNDVAGYAGSVSEWVSNNNGKLPLAAADLTDPNGVNSLANVSANTTEPTAVVTGAQTGAVALNTIQYVANARCDTSMVGNTVDATGRVFAIRFAVEGSGGAVIPQCQDS